MKVKPTRDNVFKREPYRSILNLLLKYPDDDLQPKHFRYALCKNHDKDKFNIKTYTHLEAFFRLRGRFEYLMKMNYIVEGCLKSKNVLSNFLKNMVDIGVIYEPDKAKHIYKISDDFRLIGERLRNKEAFDLYKHVMVRNIGDISSHLLYGFSDGLYNSLPKEDKDKIDTYLDEIDDRLFAIEFIRSDYIHSYIYENAIREVDYLHKDNPKLSNLLSIMFFMFRNLVRMETFETPPRIEDSEPKGFPFERVKVDETMGFDEKASIASSMCDDIHHNIIYHWDDIVKWVGLSPKKGKHIFDEMKERFRILREEFDANILSYSFCSRGVESKAIRDISKGKLISLISDVERKKTH